MQGAILILRSEKGGVGVSCNTAMPKFLLSCGQYDQRLCRDQHMVASLPFHSSQQLGDGHWLPRISTQTGLIILSPK